MREVPLAGRAQGVSMSRRGDSFAALLIAVAVVAAVATALAVVAVVIVETLGGGL